MPAGTPLKTLLFCTSYFESDTAWSERYRRWLDYYRARTLRRDALFMFDDGSPIAPPARDIATITALPDRLEPPAEYLYHFPDRLGRVALFDLPGWWRSFFFAFEVARRYGFDKVVHVESDAYILSQKMIEHVNALDRGWTAMWCPRYESPEAAIQIVARDQFDTVGAIAARGVGAMRGVFAERFLPFTSIERGFAGNRYGEYRSRIPEYADFATQVTPRQDVAFRAS